MNLKLILRDLDRDLVDAWRSAFAKMSSVDIADGDLMITEADAIVSPANSFGFMDGGIDLVYSRYFGSELQERLQKEIDKRFAGELPVGQALIVPTGNKRFPHLISAPTMRIPSPIEGTLNVYLAFRAALLAVDHHNREAKSPIRSIASPGLGTGIGAVPPARAAKQMRAAYSAVVEGDRKWRANATALLRHHYELLA
jgi:O-acetyl-ADP-ribose deacetylase (regulator of RNase III)